MRKLSVAGVHVGAYLDAEKKAWIKAEIKKVVPRGWKYSLTTNPRGLNFVLLKGDEGLWDNFIECLKNPSHGRLTARDIEDYRRDRWVGLSRGWLKSVFSGKYLELLNRIFDVLNYKNYDRSDAMTDYFDIGHHVFFSVGDSSRPYIGV